MTVFPSGNNGVLLLLAAFLVPNYVALHAGDAVSAIGFLEPEGGVLQLSGAGSGPANLLAKLNVKEGQKVQAGQVLAVMASYRALEAAMQRSRAKVAVQEARLAQLRAGASVGAVKAQKARIERLEIEIKSAADECSRARALFKEGTVSQDHVEQTCLNENVLRRSLIEAHAQLDEIREVRSVDLAVLEAELQDARAALAQSEVDLDGALIRAPIAGTILKIHAEPGELLGPKGLLEMGRTQSMWVRAEVYETDIRNVRVGQTATISSDGFENNFQGTVQEIGLIIGRNKIVSSDPLADVDARVVEVKIKIEESSSDMVSGLINLQVNVVIHTQKGLSAH